MSQEIDWNQLLEKAIEARERAYAPYSEFQVGAAILMEDGSIFQGCNVENRSFGLTICAERVAIASAVAAGSRQPRAVAVVTGTDPPSVPCGPCLEVLTEFAEADLPIVLANPSGASLKYRLKDLLPHPFVLPDP